MESRASRKAEVADYSRFHSDVVKVTHGAHANAALASVRCSTLKSFSDKVRILTDVGETEDNARAIVRYAFRTNCPCLFDIQEYLHRIAEDNELVVARIRHPKAKNLFLVGIDSAQLDAFAREVLENISYGYSYVASVKSVIRSWTRHVEYNPALASERSARL